MFPWSAYFQKEEKDRFVGCPGWGYSYLSHSVSQNLSSSLPACLLQHRMYDMGKTSNHLLLQVQSEREDKVLKKHYNSTVTIHYVTSLLHPCTSSNHPFCLPLLINAILSRGVLRVNNPIVHT